MIPFAQHTCNATMAHRSGQERGRGRWTAEHSQEGPRERQLRGAGTALHPGSVGADVWLVPSIVILNQALSVLTLELSRNEKFN